MIFSISLVHLGYQAGVLCHPLHLLLSWLSPSSLVHLGYQAGVLCHPLHLLLSWLSPSSLVHLGYQAGVLCHPLHLLPSWLSPSSKPHFFMSCLILSIHLILGLPSPRVPLTSSFIVSFTLFPSSICRMCPYQCNLACNVMFSTMKSNGSTMPTEFCQTVLPTPRSVVPLGVILAPVVSTLRQFAFDRLITSFLFSV